MPWKELGIMDERCKFVMQAMEPEANMAQLCRQFGISRKVGYKWVSRYLECGVIGLQDQSRRPLTVPTATTPELVCQIVSVRTARPTWGSKKILRVLERNGIRDLPSVRTIDRVLDRCNLIGAKRRRPKRRYPPDLVQAEAKSPNDIWTTDFKGWWLTRDAKRCEPLTIRDSYSKFILDIAALKHKSIELAKERFRSCFELHGLPKLILNDNGSPFASIESLCGLSKLSVWWIKLGITPIRIGLGKPYQNGGHERMHLDMMREIEKQPAQNLRLQQTLLDEWRGQFNYDRPHEALDMKTPSDVYRSSTRKYNPREPDFEYPASFERRSICSYGKMKWLGKKVFLSSALAGEVVGIELLEKAKINIWFADYYLGTTDIHFNKPLSKENGS